MIMKARDFMIGDWMQDGNGFPMRIVTVGEGWAYADFEGNEADPWEYRDRDFADGTANPVELTAAMLEASGFERGVHTAEWVRDADADCPTMIAVDACGTASVYKEGFRYCNGRARYVHELQHVLRLAGLNEIADNFKLE